MPTFRWQQRHHNITPTGLPYMSKILVEVINHFIPLLVDCHRLLSIWPFKAPLCSSIVSQFLPERTCIVAQRRSLVSSLNMRCLWSLGASALLVTLAQANPAPTPVVNDKRDISNVVLHAQSQVTPHPVENFPTKTLERRNLVDSLTNKVFSALSEFGDNIPSYVAEGKQPDIRDHCTHVHGIPLNPS